MIRSKKVVSALLFLDIYERNAFGKFLLSPYFNSNQAAHTYFQIIDTCIRNEKFDVEDAQIWQQAYPDIPYDHQKFLKLNSDLVKLLEAFLVQQELSKEPSVAANLKLKAAHRHNISPLINGIIGEVDRLTKLDNNRSGQYFYNRYQLELSQFNTTTENEKKKSKFEIEAQLNIDQISAHLDNFYTIEKLRMYCTLLSWKKMYQLNTELSHIDVALEFAQEPNNKEIPAVRLYYLMQATYNSPEDTQFYYELRELMKSSLHLFPETEAKEIYATAISYCINQVNKGNLDFQRETFELYKEFYNQNYFHNTSSISETAYRNIVQIALRETEFSWAENFIHSYSKYLDPKDRDNAVFFSLARVEFYRKNYNLVIENLNNVTYEDVWYSLGTKSLLLHSYYELKEDDALESLLQSFNMYIRREKSLNKERKDTYLNLVKFTTSLQKINPKDKLKLQALKEEVQATKGVVSKPWLLEKIQEKLEKK